MNRMAAVRALCMICIVMAFSGAAFERNSIWVTKLSLWTDVVSKTPGKSRVHNSMGNCYMLLDRWFDAIGEYRIALRLDPGNIEAYYNIAINLEKIGMSIEALPYYQHFCSAAPPEFTEAVDYACGRAAELAVR